VRRAAALVPVMSVLILAGVATAVAQRRGGFGGGFGGRNRREAIRPNTPYDGRFTFVRVRYGQDYGFVSQGLPWSHDYPAGEQHFMKILNELSYLHPHTDETNILTFDDPEIFKYPVAYLCEPGGWVMTDQEAAGLRTYLQKGGFVIVDDFRYQHWGNFETQISRVLPEAQTRSALEALWRYNFTPDVGTYRRAFKAIPGGRWYAGTPRRLRQQPRTTTLVPPDIMKTPQPWRRGGGQRT